MLKDDKIIATRTVASMSDLGRDNHGRGKKRRDGQDRRNKHESHDSQ